MSSSFEDYGLSINPTFCTELLQRLNQLKDNINEKARTEQRYNPLYCNHYLPNIEQLHLLLRACICASLLREEGNSYSFIVTVDSENEFWDVDHIFINQQPVVPEALIKLAPALENTATAIALLVDSGNLLKIAGFGRANGLRLAIHALAPGYIKIFFWGKPIAILKIDSAVFIDNAYLDPGSQISSLILQPVNYGNVFKWQVIKSIVRRMVQLRRGGTLIVTDQKWKKAAKQPVLYQWEKVFEAFGTKFEYNDPIDLKLYFAYSEIRTPEHNDDIKRGIKRIVPFTNVDGAVILNLSLEIEAFGVKLKPLSSKRSPKYIRVNHPQENHKAYRLPFSEIGGTRHQSACQFVFDIQCGIAIVVSQDGCITFMGWDNDNDEVFAIRHAEYSLL